ncbi:unnamed protein product [Pieris macdunnoughi]|uniref:ABC transporter domain-containing protein n=1 Tax=Pieris macdunnoughi TaxID=345717 RepID=A0A821MAU7_9NEOP|nr:unnamed protein product [Pieris macdunnoughi]
MAGVQLRLLLWKDYLMRKRNPITVAGILWAIGVISSICIVRFNIDNQDFPTCQFAARALPSAGLLTFLQSFICNVNNECTSMDEFQEIPTFEQSKLTQLKRQLMPLVSNESIVEVAGSIPDALKLIATLADVADEPTFLDITKNGIRVTALFRNPTRVKRYLEEKLNIDEDVATSVISAQIGIGSIMNGTFDRCNADSMKKVIKIENAEHLGTFVNELCSISKDDLQKIYMDLVWEMDLGKYISMAGNMYAKLSGDERLAKVGNMTSAVLRMLSIHSFLPPEVDGIIYGTDSDFSYVPVSLIKKFINLFEPVFGETDAYKSLKDFTDASITGVQFLNKALKKGGNTSDILNNEITDENPVDVFNILSRITNLILKFVSKEQKHDALFYSTLLSKLIEVANKMVDINTNIEKLIYEVSSRNPKGVRVLLSLPLDIVEKGLEGLADPERAQIITSNLENPAQPFCDVQRITKFFLLSKDEATDLRTRLCTEEWKMYVQDMVASFGTYEAKNNINAIASLFVMEALGSDVSDKLYSIDRDFAVLNNFTQRIANLDKVKKPEMKWDKIFNEKDAEFLKVVKEKESLGKHILLTVHGCLAKEVVRQNTLLEFKLSPLLKDATSVVAVVNEQLNSSSKETAQRLKEMYPELLKVLAITALDENKTFRSLSTASEDIFCRGLENANRFLSFPPSLDAHRFINTICDVSKEIENGLRLDSVLSLGIAEVKNANHSVLEEINWTKLIKGIKQLYMTLEEDFPYVLEFRSYGMDKLTQEQIGQLFAQAKDYWLSLQNLKRSVLLVLNMGLRALDLLDHEAFGLNQDTWLHIKYYMAVVTGPLDVIHDFIQYIYNISQKVRAPTDIPPESASVIHKVLSSLPQLIVESVDVIVRDDVQVDQIVNILNADTPWPCGRSLTEVLSFPSTKHAVTSLENLVCFNRTFQEEWKKYLDEKNVTLYKTSHWNETVLAPHVFLKFSKVFDRTIEDFNSINELAHNILEEPERRETRDDSGLNLKSSWKYTMDTFNTSQGDTDLRNFLTKVDLVINSITTSTPDDVSLNTLWTNYMNCSSEVYMDDACAQAGRGAWINLFKFISMAVGNATDDLGTYLREANGANSTILQVFGFTSKTALYSMYAKASELIGVLINSYWDFGFMQQVRRASLTQFWDCEAVLSSLTPGPGSSITEEMLLSFHPLVCPSMLYWLSMPVGANTLFDVITKPQYLFFTLHVESFGSVFNKAYVTTTELSNTLKELSKNETDIDLSLVNLKSKLEITVDKLISYKITEDDPSYLAFREIVKKQVASSIYLTRTVEIVNKMYDLLSHINIDDVVTNVSEADKKSIETDISSLTRLFRRRASEVVGIHFDVITDVIWTNRNDYKITNSLEMMCDNLKNNVTKEMLGDNARIKGIICSKHYKIIYNAVQHVVDDDFEETRHSLLTVVKVLQNVSNEDVNDIVSFLNEKQQIIFALKKSIKYASDLDIPIYLKYLESNIEHYTVVLKFLSGDDWWKALKNLYAGNQSKAFLDSVERSFDIASDVLNNLDKIHLVKLFRDTNVNDTESFCRPNMTLSDYLPDGTGLLSAVHGQLCGDKSELFKDIPPLLFASQGYDDALKLQPTVDYRQLNDHISSAEANLLSVVEEVRTPMVPEWVTDGNLAKFRSSVLNLLSKETITKVAFGTMSNFVDASTLYLNETYCGACSHVTGWAKQITLQLFKKQEYEEFLCNVRGMSPKALYHVIENTFHWDMAIGELISIRNYTKYELNKSLNEFLEQTKVILLEDMNSNSRLSECLASDVDRNIFGNITLVSRIISNFIEMIKTELPHLQEVEGFSSLPYIVQLKAQIASHISVPVTLQEIEKDEVDLGDALNEDLGGAFDTNYLQFIYHLDLHKVNGFPLPTSSFKMHKHICKEYNCTEVVAALNNILNYTKIEKMLSQLPELQQKEFWKFRFVTDILDSVQMVLERSFLILRFLSKMDFEGVAAGKLTPMINLAMQMQISDTLHNLISSVEWIAEELSPLLHNTTLRRDMAALMDGLKVLFSYKEYIVDRDVNVTISEVFQNPDRIESSLKDIGVNNTEFLNFLGVLHDSKIRLRPLLLQENGLYDTKKFVCNRTELSQIIVPDTNVTDDFFSAVSDQFCDLPDERAKKIVPILIENINTTFFLDRIKSFLLNKLYAALNVTADEGDTLFDKLSEMAILLPSVRQNVADVTDSLADEPLIRRLKDGFSIGGFMSSPETLAEVGNMMCGKPFLSGVSRFYKSIVNSVDLSSQPDEEQLRVLPTDFCRSVYTDIVNMEGGKIIWSFVKPLIMGKILYTPHGPNILKIIEKANSTFAPMVKMFNLIHKFSDAFPSIDKMSKHRVGLKALGDLLSAEDYRQIRVTLFGNVSAPQIDVDELLSGIGDSEGLGRLLKKASNLMRCINLDRFKAVSDEHRLTEEAARLSRINEFTAGLVFLNMSHDEETFPRNIEYKIRMDIENAPTTKRTKNYLWTPGPEASFLENMRYFRGFVQVQDIVEKAIVQLSDRRPKRDVSVDEDWAVYTQQNPYPCYRKDIFQTSLYESQALIVAFFFSFLFTVSSAVRFTLADKESGNTMLMSVMGVNLSYHTLSWFLSSLIEMSVTMLLVSCVLYYGKILPNTTPTLTFTLLFIFGLSVLSFCYLMGKLFTSASVGAICAALGYLTTFMPFVLILSLEAVLTSGLKIFVSLSMSSSLCYAFLFICRFEAMGVGADWSKLWESPDDTGDMNIGLAAAMMVVDACLYFLLGHIVERIWGLKKVQSNVTYISSTDEKAGVSIINITKVYSRGAKPALSGVSVELRPGQVTTLLGHNGAGKSTLINILTGMLKPTSGQVVIRSGSGGSTRVGVCPQRDVLYEHMTAREHVHLYATLNNAPSSEVDGILKVVSLGHVCDEPVSRLSGGTRRRLCVALAFVGRPNLVTLDEPTSGVDPQARREIWSMIMKLRVNRTILLTTHHLDEAELLSDQVVIMHKGQIHTTGSPIEIKRTLGSGYKLTVLYPGGTQDIEEKTRQVLELTRNVVNNASLVDVTGDEVEINVPFYDEDGVSTDFEVLCSTLEDSSGRLGYRSYGMECTSLEQVFFNICDRDDVPSNPSAVDATSKSVSSSSIKTDHAPLVPPEGPLKASAPRQFLALLHKRYIHYIRNRWLLFLLLVLPSLFVTVAMGFASIRPPADNEISLRLHPDLYRPTTDYLVRPSIPVPENILGKRVMDILRYEQNSRNWTKGDSLTCKCVDTIQQCEIPGKLDRPNLMVLPDVNTLNDWLVTSQQAYIEKRYGGYSSSVSDDVTHLTSWYNNKGHHALPAYLNRLNEALLKASTGEDATLTLYTHPLKISNEQLNKDNVYQHVADAGISAMLLIGYSLVSAGAAIYLVTERTQKQKRLQLLCGVSPTVYWSSALICDMIVILVNLAITVVILKIFNFPVFVARNNLSAICVLIVLYGYACAGVVYVSEKWFKEPSLANMVLFCGNTFVALGGIAILLVLDIISDSDATDHARWVLHKVFLLSPQFVLADGLLEIAKNTIQAQVLGSFGMDTYRDPLSSSLVLYHYISLLAVGTALFGLNLAFEYGCFDDLLSRFAPRYTRRRDESSEEDVVREERRVTAAVSPLRLRTIGNINAGFVDSNEDLKSNSLKRSTLTGAKVTDVISCVHVSKMYPAVSGFRVAVDDLTLGIPAFECTALVGQNGAGKSSTFAMLTAEVRPTSGHVYVHRHEASQRDLCRGLISYCPQRDALDCLLTVRETLQFFCKLRGITDEEVIKRTLEQFELTKYSSSRSGVLSGGNKRKLCTAVAFMGRNPLVLLDEPTSGMDPGSRACVSRAWLRACKVGRGVLLSTHALHDARRAHRVALLRDGRLTAIAPLDQGLARFGGGYVVCARVCEANPGGVRAVWERVAEHAPHATLTAAHAAAVHFIVPTLVTESGKETVTPVSSIFRVMSELQRDGLVEDFTLNQTSLEQMFLKGSADIDAFTLESETAAPPDLRYRRSSDELSTVTAL